MGMQMRLIPHQAPSSATATERKVFGLLRELAAGPAAVAFSSVNLSDHEYKKWGEIDIVVITPVGLYIGEIKGGAVSCDERGVWRYEARGKVPIERLESPMAQAASAFFSLRNKRLYPALGKALVDAAISGFFVVLANTTESEARHLVGGTEMPSDLIALSDDVADAASFAAFLTGVAAYWRAHGSRTPRRWTDAEVRNIAQEIRPWFDRVPPLSLAVSRIREEHIALTDDQYRILDFCEQAPRVVCKGGAGCGKTLLAIETLRREARSDPVLITGTEKLAGHIRATAGIDSDRVLSYSELLAGRLPAGRRFRTLVVDEGQQLTNASAIDMLGELIVGGMQSGRWRWFCDPNNQVLSSSRFDASVQSDLEGMAFLGHLDRNCRNTTQIIGTVRVVTGAAVGISHAKGQGPEVEFAAASDLAEQIAAAAAQIQAWIADPEIRPGDVALLSPKPLEVSSIPLIAKAAGVEWRQWEPGWDQKRDFQRCVAAATVEDFRGIESPFVVLCDINDDTQEPVENLYLGMTRANFGLFVMADHGVVQRAAREAANRRQDGNVRA